MIDFLIEEGQERGQKDVAQILSKIEEGQRKGFEILEKSFLKMSEVLAKGH